MIQPVPAFRDRKGHLIRHAAEPVPHEGGRKAETLRAASVHKRDIRPGLHAFQGTGIVKVMELMYSFRLFKQEVLLRPSAGDIALQVHAGKDIFIEDSLFLRFCFDIICPGKLPCKGMAVLRQAPGDPPGDNCREAAGPAAVPVYVPGV